MKEETNFCLMTMIPIFKGNPFPLHHQRRVPPARTSFEYSCSFISPVVLDMNVFIVSLVFLYVAIFIRFAMSLSGIWILFFVKNGISHLIIIKQDIYNFISYLFTLILKQLINFNTLFCSFKIIRQSFHIFRYIAVLKNYIKIYTKIILRKFQS